MHVSTSYEKPDSDTERKAEADFTVKSFAETSDGILLSSAQLFILEGTNAKVELIWVRNNFQKAEILLLFWLFGLFCLVTGHLRSMYRKTQHEKYKRTILWKNISC